MPETASLEMPLAIIADEDIVLGFKAIGFRVYARREQSQLASIIEEVIRQQAAVCLVQDNIYRQVQELINNYKSLPLPVFIPFSLGDGTDALDNILSDIRIRAIGAF